MQEVCKTFREQQRLGGDGPYSFQRRTSWATDGVPLSGYGYPAKKIGLIHSMFRPSDDATLFPFLVPGNFFAARALQQLHELARDLGALGLEFALHEDLQGWSRQLYQLLQQYGSVPGPGGKIYAYEINGYGSFHLMDDANVPSLLSLPYLGAVSAQDPQYLRTRSYLLSDANPFFYQGQAGAGIGGPHAGKDMIWPLSIIMRGLTSSSDAEISQCLGMLQHCHAGTGFMHESFHKDDPRVFTRKWFAWANTLFGELVWKVYRERPHLLDEKIPAAAGIRFR
jgi:uncharacterized protein